MGDLPDKKCPRCGEMVEVHLEGWFQDHFTPKGNSCGMSGAPAYKGSKLEKLQEEYEYRKENLQQNGARDE